MKADMLLSVERPIVGAFALGGPGATLLHRSGLVQAVLPASVRTRANGQSRFPRNVGDPVVFSEIPGRRYRVTNSRPRRCTRPPRSENNECNRGTAKRRQRSAAGWALGSRSTLIVPMKPGNRSRGTRWREGKNRKGVSDVDGTMSDYFYGLCEVLGRWMDKNRESLLGVQGGPWPEQVNVPVTTKDNGRTWYVFAWPQNDKGEFLNPQVGNRGEYDYTPKDKVVVVTGVGKEPSKVTVLATGERLDYQTHGKTLSLTIPADRTTPLLDVIKVQW